MRIRILLLSIVIAAGLCLPGCSRFGGSRQPGPRIILQVEPKPGDQWPASASGRSATLDKVKEIIEKRAQSLPVTGEPTVTTQAPDKIVVELPGITNAQAAASQLSATGSLEFYYMRSIQTPVNPLAKWKMEPVPGDEKCYLFTGSKGETLNSGKPADMTKILAQIIGTPGVKPVLTGADLLPNAKSALRPQTNQPVIEIEFSARGSKVFADFTGKHVGEILGIFYDGTLLTAPRINEAITGGKAEISGFSGLKEATDIAGILNSGALPVHLNATVQKYYQP